MTNQVSEFLTKYGMHYDSIDLDRCMRDFVDDMRSGLDGDVKSMLMIPTYVSTRGEVPVNKPIIVLDAGGTNFRVATVTFTENGEAVIGNFEKHRMPGTYGEMTKDEFFDKLADFIEPLSDISDSVGFCFSFPTEILPNCDGRLIGFNKEVQVKDSAGVIIGESINEALRRRGLPEKHFVLLNDTVAAMLGGIAAFPNRKFDSYIGFILGTGTNTCYIEQVSDIGRLGGGFSGDMAINMESGGFDGFGRGEIDEKFDATTANAGEHKFEKMISGAYQGSVIYMTLLQAAEDGIVSMKTAAALKELGDLTMRQIDEFCLNTKSGNTLADLAANEHDRTVIYDIIDASFERAARTVCINLGGILVKTGKGKNPEKPVCVSAEGTTFAKSVLFRPKLDRYIKEYLNDKLGYYLEFVKVENATLIGSAVAGLLN